MKVRIERYIVALPVKMNAMNRVKIPESNLLNLKITEPQSGISLCKEGFFANRAVSFKNPEKIIKDDKGCFVINIEVDSYFNVYSDDYCDVFYKIDSLMERRISGNYYKKIFLRQIMLNGDGKRINWISIGNLLIPYYEK